MNKLSHTAEQLGLRNISQSISADDGMPLADARILAVIICSNYSVKGFIATLGFKKYRGIIFQFQECCSSTCHTGSPTPSST
jgi:hypothetical protein